MGEKPDLGGRTAFCFAICRSNNCCCPWFRPRRDRPTRLKEGYPLLVSGFNPDSWVVAGQIFWNLLLPIFRLGACSPSWEREAPRTVPKADVYRGTLSHRSLVCRVMPLNRRSRHAPRSPRDFRTINGLLPRNSRSDVMAVRRSNPLPQRRDKTRQLLPQSRRSTRCFHLPERRESDAVLGYLI